jgi:hypothetical protein
MMMILKTPTFSHVQRIAAIAAIASLAACGACNCNVPGFTAGVAPAAGVVVAPGTVVLPPGVVLPPAGAPPAAALSCNQAAGAFALGPALAPFAILASATVTNTGNTIVTYAAGATTGTFNDDLIGVSPGTAVVGFYPPGVDTDGPSAIYAVGAGFTNTPAVPAAAQGALTTAFNTLAGTAATTVFPGGQDLSRASVPGHPTGTLPPGVYKSASTMGILAGNLTLDAGGNPQAVFIFQAGSALTTTLNGGAGGNIVLAGGTTACNIYWQVGSSAVLGGATFYGNVLALASVTLTSSTQFTGRALASTGAVTISTATLVTNPGGK